MGAGGSDDPFRVMWDALKLPETEPDTSKKEVCRFFCGRAVHTDILYERTGCNKGAGCTYSHHPSMMWKDVLSSGHVVGVLRPKRVDMQDWTVCDIPPFYFGLVFSVSRMLEREFKIIIKVPRREQVEDPSGSSIPHIRMYGSVDNVKACMERLSSILPVRVSAIHDKADQDDTDSDDPIPILWESIGLSPSDPLRKLCDDLGIHENDTTETDRYRTQALAYLSICEQTIVHVFPTSGM